MYYAVSRDVYATYTQRSHYVATCAPHCFCYVNTLCIPGNVSLPKVLKTSNEYVAGATDFRNVLESLRFQIVYWENHTTTNISSPDITTVFNTLYNRTSWTTQHALSSDHLPIIATINIQAHSPPLSNFKDTAEDPPPVYNNKPIKHIYATWVQNTTLYSEGTTHSKQHRSKEVQPNDSPFPNHHCSTWYEQSFRHNKHTHP